MNKKQQALYDAVKAAGGILWVSTDMNFYRNQVTKSVGRSQMNAAHSMLPATVKEYCPGGFRREVKLTLIEEQKVHRYFPEGELWMVTSERLLVKILHQKQAT